MTANIAIEKVGEDPGGAPIVGFDPFEEAALRDPFPYYEALRQHGPVVKLAPHDCWAAFGFEEVVEILRDWETFSSEAGIGLANYRKVERWRPPSLVLEADPPKHDVPRKVLGRLLLPRNLSALHDAFEAQAEVFADRIVDKRSFDGIADLAVPYPLEVFSDALGLPKEGRENLLPYARLVFNGIYEGNALFAEAQREAERAIPWVAKMCARESVDRDGLAEEIYRAVDSGELSEEQAPLLVRSYLSAGIDTTVTSIGHALYVYARFPEQWERLLREPERIRSAFDEVLRWSGAVLHFFRTTTRDAQIGGVRIPAEQKVMVCFAAANRDPRRWEDPDRFDVHRNAKGQIAFGQGVHVCVGRSLAILEAELIFKALAKRVRRFELVGEPEIRLNNSLRGFSTLPMRIVPH